MNKGLVMGWLLAFLLSTPVQAEELTKVRILALSPADARVVLKDETGQVKILAPGDSLLGGELKVRQVLVDRLVLVDAVGHRSSAMIWLFKPQSEQAQPRVQRFTDEPEDNVEVLDVIESSSRLDEVKPARAAD